MNLLSLNLSPPLTQMILSRERLRAVRAFERRLSGVLPRMIHQVLLARKRLAAE